MIDGKAVVSDGDGACPPGAVHYTELTTPGTRDVLPMGKARATITIFFLSSFALLLVAVIAFAATKVVGSESHSSAVHGYFVDATEKLGIHFQHQDSPTSKKYLLETMGSGVAVFDYDN